MHSLSKIISVLISCFIFSLASAQSAGGNKPEAPKRPQLPKGMTAIEPAALDLLKVMTTKLSSAKTMQFEALVQSEFPSIDGLPVIYSTAAKVALQRPNKFDVVVWGDGPSSEVLFNGKSCLHIAQKRIWLPLVTVLTPLMRLLNLPTIRQDYFFLAMT